jgi:hypothetical protein
LCHLAIPNGLEEAGFIIMVEQWISREFVRIRKAHASAFGRAPQAWAFLISDFDRSLLKTSTFIGKQYISTMLFKEMLFYPA